METYKEGTGEISRMDTSVKTDIVIPFFNQHKLLSRCLRSIEASGYRDGRVVIVNDGSDPNDVNVIEGVCADLKLDILLISHDCNKGYRESILTGVTKCNHRYLILVNSDTVVTRNFSVRLTDVMRKNSEIKAVAPISNHPTDLYQFRKKIYLKREFDDHDYDAIIARFEPLLSKQGLLKRLFAHDNITIAPYLSANCLALDREIFEKAGYFHNDYDHGYFEDLDLCCSIRNLGYRLAVREDCFVFHRGQGSYREKSREEKEKQIWKNYYIFEKRWGHLPEHDDLCKRMHYAGREYPI